MRVHRCILCAEIRELNLQAFPRRRKNSAAAFKLIPSGAPLVAHTSFQSYAKPESMRPQNYCQGKHPDVVITDFSGLLDN
jgi:hypothetical protein